MSADNGNLPNSSMRDAKRVDLAETGLLWLINKVVFHPRGYMLGQFEGTGTFLLVGNGTEPVHFGPDTDEQDQFNKVNEVMP